MNYMIHSFTNSLYLIYHLYFKKVLTCHLLPYKHYLEIDKIISSTSSSLLILSHSIILLLFISISQYLSSSSHSNYQTSFLNLLKDAVLFLLPKKIYLSYHLFFQIEKVFQFMAEFDEYFL